MRWTMLAALVAAPLLAQVNPPNSAGVAMGHLHIIVPDPEVHAKLWTDVLGGKLVKAGPLEYAMFPGAFVGYRKGESNGGTEGSVLDHVAFQVRSLAAMKARLAAAKVPLVREMPETHQVLAMFPDGIKLEFTDTPALDVPIKFDHLHFATPRYEEMRGWYAKTFGAVPGTRGRFLAANLPGANLSWKPAEAPTAPTKGRALDHIGFEVRDIAAFCRGLESAGLKLDMPPTPRPDLGLTIAFLTDAWGTRIELTEGLAKLH